MFDSSASIQRNTALCYIRQSFTKNDRDLRSAEHQRATILAVCEERGWIPEWYQDARHHKTAIHEQNRPAWMALKKRLRDHDVIALVAYDLSRLHRNHERMMRLIDFTLERGIHLVLTRKDQQIDFSTPQGRLYAEYIAKLDQWTSQDSATRMKDQLAYLKSMGQVIGAIPFGATRNENGYLEPSIEGAWLMPDGNFQAGTDDVSLHPLAIWRGYYDACKRLLQLYSTGEMGANRIAYILNKEGWTHRGRNGEPSPFSGDDVFRAIQNWPEYGGIVTKSRAKERKPSDYNLSEIVFDETHALFPTSMLYDVARTLQERTKVAIRKHDIQSIKPDDKIYPLSGITFCAYCEERATQFNNPKLRSPIYQFIGDGKKRYRHEEGILCETEKRSLAAEIYDEEFERLLKLLTLRTDIPSGMVEVIQNQSPYQKPIQDSGKAIEDCKKKLHVLLREYLAKQISYKEFWGRTKQFEEEIEYWQTFTVERANLEHQLRMCMNILERITMEWDGGNNATRKNIVHTLFDSVIFNIDQQRIVDFRLKPWTTNFIVLREPLYKAEYVEPEDRNEAIRQKWLNGRSQAALAREYDLSPNRIYQIVHRKNR